MEKINLNRGWKLHDSPFAGKRKSWQKLNYIRMGGLHVIYLQMSECR